MTVDNFLYLRATLTGLIIVLCVYLFFPNRRKVMLLHAATLLPVSLLAILHQDTYWKPTRLFGGSYGFEDLIFCFSVGSLTAFAAYLPIRNTIHFRLEDSRVLKRSFIMLLGTTALFLCCLLLQIDVMTTTILIQVVLVGTLQYFKRELILPGLYALVGYTAYYCCFILAFNTFYPGFLKLWDGPGLWAMKIGLIPLEEILWVSTFSCAWVFIIGYAYDITIETTE
jgi:hypothetical protein